MPMRRRSRRSSTRTSRGRRHAKLSVLPFNMCGRSVVIPPVNNPETDSYTCKTPYNAEFVLLDGNAFNFRNNSPIGNAPDEIYLEGLQLVNHGIRFYGMEWWMKLEFNDQPNNFLDHQYAIYGLRIMCAIVKRRWIPIGIDTAEGRSEPVPLPNLFSRDEDNTKGAGGHVLYRWPLYLGPIVQYSGDDPNFVSQLMYCDTQGGSATLIVDTVNQSALSGWTGLGPASSNQTHHKLRRGCFLNEMEYLALCLSVTTPWSDIQHDTFAIGLEANGVMKARGF